MSVVKKAGILFFTVFIAGLIVIALSFQHWWLEYVGSAVFLNDEYYAKGKVFRNSQGEILISTNGGNDGELYVYLPSQKLIGFPNNSQFIFLPFCAYNKDVPTPVVLSSSAAKIDWDVNLVEHGEWIEFTGFGGHRIKVYRNNI